MVLNHLYQILRCHYHQSFDGSDIEVFGKGDLEPLQKEAEEFGEAVNRRVEVFFISN